MERAFSHVDLRKVDENISIYVSAHESGKLVQVQVFHILWVEVRVLGNEASRKPFNEWAEGRLSREESLRKASWDENEPAVS